MRRRLAMVLLAVVTALVGTPTAVLADDGEDGPGVRGTIDQPQPVEGLTITVYEGDTEVATAETDEDGEWEAPLDSGGTYRIVLDEDSVPDDLVIAGQGPERELTVQDNSSSVVLFALSDDPGQEWQPEDDAAGAESPASDEESEEPEASPDGEAVGEDEAAGEGEEATEEEIAVDEGAPFADRLAQTALSGLIYGMIIAICSVGLSLIFGTTRMINFAHGDLVTFGGMIALMFTVGAAGVGNALLGSTASILLAIGAGALLSGRAAPRVVRAVQWVVAVAGTAFSVLYLGFFADSLDWRVPLVVAGGLAVLLGAALGGALERFLWRPLRHRNVALIQMFIVSIGVAILLRHLLLVLFGGSRNNFREYRIQESWTLGPLSITPRDFTIMVIAAVVLVAVASMLQFTRVGKAMRAVSDNRDLAESSGINVDRVTLYVWMLAGGLSALGGVLYGLNVAVFYEMGFFLLLLMFAAVILGGLGTAYGAMVGGLFIGLIAQLSTLWFPVQLMRGWALALMIVMLLVRPQGILGRRERVG